jgi:hypothetical protein
VTEPRRVRQGFETDGNRRRDDGGVHNY